MNRKERLAKPLGKEKSAIGKGRTREWGLKRTRLGIWEKGEGSMKNKRGLGGKQARARRDLNEGSAI